MNTLDMQLAKVIGWTLGRDLIDGVWYLKDSNIESPIPAYSSDWVAMGHLVSELERNEFQVVIWTAGREEDSGTYFAEVNTAYTCHKAEGQSLPEAIARAALEALSQ